MTKLALYRTQIRSLGHLASGALSAQVIPILMAPVLTRLYTATDYAALATFGALTAVVAALCSGRYYMAILLPDDHASAMRVTELSLRVIAISTLGMSCLAALTWPWTSQIHAIDALSWWVLAIPVAGGLLSVNDTLTMAMLRLGETGAIARSAFTRTISSAVSQMALGIAQISAGLLGGVLVGAALGNRRMALSYLSRRREHVSDASMMSLSHRYRAFPRVEMWANLANSLSFNLVVLGLGLLYSQKALGQYALAFRLLVLPSAVVGSSIGQLYMRSASEKRHNPHAARRTYDATARLLACLAAPAFLALYLSAEPLFSFVFGAEWEEAGKLAIVISPLICIRFVVSPLSSVFIVYERQSLLLRLQLLLLLVPVASLLVAHLWQLAIANALLCNSLLGGLVYVGMFWTGRRLVCQGRVSQ